MYDPCSHFVISLNAWHPTSLALHNLTFTYQSQPTIPVLSDVSLYLPAHEMTFIVGSSGSGKSTIASLLLGLYKKAP